MQTLEMISALSNACGPSGFEDDALRAVRQFAPAGYALAGDALNNLYLRREKADGKRRKEFCDRLAGLRNLC